MVTSCGSICVNYYVVFEKVKGYRQKRSNETFWAVMEYQYTLEILWSAFLVIKIERFFYTFTGCLGAYSQLNTAKGAFGIV